MLNIVAAQSQPNTPLKLVSGEADASADVGLFSLFSGAKLEGVSEGKVGDKSLFDASAFFQMVASAEKTLDVRNVVNQPSLPKAADGLAVSLEVKPLLVGADKNSLVDVLPKPRLEEKWLRGDDASLVVAAPLPNIQNIVNVEPVAVAVLAPVIPNGANGGSQPSAFDEADVLINNSSLVGKDLLPVAPILSDEVAANIAPVVAVANPTDLLPEVSPEIAAFSAFEEKKPLLDDVDKNDVGKIIPMLSAMKESVVADVNDAGGDVVSNNVGEKSLPLNENFIGSGLVADNIKAAKESEVVEVADTFSEILQVKDASVSASGDARDGIVKSNSQADGPHKTVHEQPKPTIPLPEQISVHIRQAVREGRDSISVRMDPAELGTVEIKLEVNRDGKTHIMVSADNHNTLSALQSDSKGLERVINSAGIKTDNASLQFNLRGGGDNNGAGGSNSQQQAADQQDGRNKQAYVPLSKDDMAKNAGVVERSYAFAVNSGLDIKV